MVFLNVNPHFAEVNADNLHSVCRWETGLSVVVWESRSGQMPRVDDQCPRVWGLEVQHSVCSLLVHWRDTADILATYLPHLIVWLHSSVGYMGD